MKIFSFFIQVQPQEGDDTEDPLAADLSGF